MEIFAIIVVAIGAFVALSLAILRVSPDDTFEAYKNHHPELVSEGKVKCFNCQGTTIWMRAVASSPFGVKHAHTCRNCGTELYRS